MSKLEKVLELLINEQREDAERLLHDWFVEQARNIHQELVAEDDHVIEDEILDDEFDVEEANDEIDAETMFGEKDLAEDDEDGEEEDELAIDDAEDDLESDMDFGDSEDDLEAGEDEDLDLGDDADEEVDLEDKVDDLAAELEALKAEFDALNGDVEGDEELDNIEGEDDFGSEEGDDFGDDAEEIEGDEVDGEDEFDDLGEGIVDTLTKVETSNSTSEIAAGKTFSANNTSPLPQKKVGDRAFTGKPVAVKSDKHNGYAKEAAPATQSGTGSKKPRNVRSTGTDEQSAVVDGGDKSALLNKTTAKPNTKSPIGSKGSIGNDKTPGKP